MTKPTTIIEHGKTHTLHERLSNLHRISLRAEYWYCNIGLFPQISHLYILCSRKPIQFYVQVVFMQLLFVCKHPITWLIDFIVAENISTV